MTELVEGTPISVSNGFYTLQEDVTFAGENADTATAIDAVVAIQNAENVTLDIAGTLVADDTAPSGEGYGNGLGRDGIVSDLASSGLDLTLGATGRVEAEGDGIHLRGSNNAIVNDGEIHGAVGAIVLGTPFAIADGAAWNNPAYQSSGNTVFNHGSLYSIADTVEIAGDGNRLENTGLISAGFEAYDPTTPVADDPDAVKFRGHGNVFINHESGKVIAADDAVSMSYFTDNGSVVNTVINDGLIQSKYDDGIAFWGAKDYLEAGVNETARSVVINNATGVIEALGVGSEGREDPYAIEGSNGIEEITNYGTILGRIWLHDGDDKYVGKAGGTVSGTVDGAGGNDTLYGSTGVDQFLGGSGDDTLLGRRGDDVLSGGEGNDLVKGGAGNDVLNGDAGEDNLHGGGGRDVLRGGEGNDVLEGGNGHDLIRGDAGSDLLTGGRGRDTFFFAAGDGNDTISDFDLNRDAIGLIDMSLADLDAGALSEGRIEVAATGEILAETGVDMTTATFYDDFVF
jgi:Ca2+-binding RTX toxin-like protein